MNSNKTSSSMFNFMGGGNFWVKALKVSGTGDVATTAGARPERER